MGMKQLQDGYYWFLAPNSCRPEIVIVDNKYTFRRKVVPMVIGMGWKDPLDHPYFDQGMWDGPVCPSTKMRAIATGRKVETGV
jgi:hypothetical protein